MAVMGHKHMTLRRALLKAQYPWSGCHRGRRVAKPGRPHTFPWSTSPHRTWYQSQPQQTDTAWSPRTPGTTHRSPRRPRPRSARHRRTRGMQGTTPHNPPSLHPRIAPRHCTSRGAGPKAARRSPRNLRGPDCRLERRPHSKGLRCVQSRPLTYLEGPPTSARFYRRNLSAAWRHLRRKPDSAPRRCGLETIHIHQSGDPSTAHLLIRQRPHGPHPGRTPCCKHWHQSKTRT